MCGISILCVLSVVVAFSQTSVVTWHNDIARTGQNLNETTLVPANVNSAQFGKLFAYPVDGYVYAQPLYVPNIAVAGKGTHNVVFVATEHDSVYAFDGDSNGGPNSQPLWRASLTDAAHGAAPGATSVTDQSISADIVPEYGITGTPVIDPASGTLYVVSFTQEASAYVQRLHALDISSGAEKFGGPSKLQATTAGTGNGSSGGVLTFDPKWENQRPALLLLNGIVYIAYAAHGDNGPWHGWILSYDAFTLAQVGSYCNSPNGFGSGIWMSGAGPAAEINDPINHPFGRMFVANGNGDFNATVPNTNQMDYGESHVNLDLSGGRLTVSDSFTTTQWATLNGRDGDVGSGGVLLLPDQPGAHPHLLVSADKTGIIYLIDRDRMGGYSTSTDKIVEELIQQVQGLWSTPAYWNNVLYFGGSGDSLKAFSLINGKLSTSAIARSAEKFDYPGTTPAISANGNSNGIVWAIDGDGYGNGAAAVLQAHDASDVTKLLYSSDQIPARDSAGPAVKFQVPTIVNGKVYVAGQKLLAVYGLFSGGQSASTPVITPGSETISGPITVTIVDATPSSTIYYTLDGSPPTSSSSQYTGPLTVTSTTTVKAIVSADGYLQSAVASASYKFSGQADAPTFSPPAGSYVSAQTVTLNDPTVGVHLFYTTDGSTPNSSSTPYTGPLSISSTTTVKAIGTAAGFTDSPIATASYVIQQSGTAIDFSQGFSQSRPFLMFNGSTTLNDTRLQLTSGGINQAGSAFYITAVPVTSFTTDFIFQLSNPRADGIAFTIQGNSPKALGASGGGLGYQNIGASIGIKFDLYSNAGEGINSTGLYMNGAAPTLPAINLAGSGIDLHSGHNFAVHLGYDGATLSMTLTDSVTSNVFSTSWTVNIPRIVGGNTAYFGFTGGTGGQTASQKIETWTYLAGQASAAPPASAPVFSPSGGTFPGGQEVSLSDSTPGATIYYTLDGSTPTISASTYSSPLQVTSTETIKAIVTAPGYSTSPIASATFTIVTGGGSGGSPSYAQGLSSTGMTLNGGATVSNGLLQLTDGNLYEARSAFYTTPVSINGFATDFTFQLQNANSDGFAFVIQGQGPTALGSYGAGLGFGPNYGGPNNAISNGVCIKFDLYDNFGEGNNSIGVFSSGSIPSTPSKDLTRTGIDLHSGHVFLAHIVYDGASVTVFIRDQTTQTTFVQSFPINIEGVVGSNSAYVGFTASTGGFSAVQNIISWTYTPGLGVNHPNGFTSNGTAITLNGGAAVSGGVLQLTSAASGKATSAFTSAPVAVQNFTTDFSFQILNPGADGFAFVIQSVGPTALGSPGGGLGYGTVQGGPSIASSVGLKFDIYSNAGEGTSSTGLYLNGAAPTTPALNLLSSGIDLHSGHVFDAHLTYDGTNLVLTLTDRTTGAVFTNSWPINIPQVIGNANAFVGFTGGIGGLRADQNILKWTYSSTVRPIFSSSFSNFGMTLNGGGGLTNGILQLTDGGKFQTRSAFASRLISTAGFTTDFNFQLTNAAADGFAFVVQSQNATALGSGGAGLGYGRSDTGAKAIGNSVALKFDLYNNAGEGPDSTGIYVNGASPTLPSSDLSNSGIDLHSGDMMHVHLVYDGTNLVLTLSDLKTGASYTGAYPINIAAVTNSLTAYVGFTASTGGSSAIQNILSWTISAGLQ